MVWRPSVTSWVLGGTVGHSDAVVARRALSVWIGAYVPILLRRCLREGAGGLRSRAGYRTPTDPRDPHLCDRGMGMGPDRCGRGHLWPARGLRHVSGRRAGIRSLAGVQSRAEAP